MQNLQLFFCLAAFAMGCGSHEQKEREINGPGETGIDAAWVLAPFTKIDAANPILSPGTGKFLCPVRNEMISWEQKDVFNPAVVVKNDTVFMIYRAEDTLGKYAGTSRLGLAWSTDGIHFTREPVPVFFPGNDSMKIYEWEGGCEDPRIVERSDGVYCMTYTAYDGKIARLMVASSKDLRSWTKHGPAFSGKYRDIWSKSGSIVAVYYPESHENGNTMKGRIIAMRIDGQYWMYWGDVNINAATSDDLIHWTPVLYGNGEKPSIELRHNSKETPEIKIVFGPRPKKFDSDLVEPGPPAMYTDAGIVLLYNSRNTLPAGDSTLPEGTYAAGQVLIDKGNPMRVLQRTDTWFIRPDKPYETTGQVNHVCFVEGLARFNKKWFLYYGTADSKIAVAVKE